MENPKINLGVNVIGHVSGEFGIGEGVRSNIRAMEAAGIPLVLKDIKVAWHRNLDQTYTAMSDKNPYPINFFHINPDEKMFQDIGYEYFQGKYNIGFWAWELQTCPQPWLSAFDLFDEIWTPSNYTAQALSKVSPIPVLKIPHSIYFPQPSVTRENLGLPNDKFIFLFVFDFRSTFARKNPFAVIEAFKKAFDKSNKDVLLVLKFSNADNFPKKLQKLLAEVNEHSSIKIINRHLMKEELHGLINSCDCYISLHRAEGFGLTMAEAMYYNKPVIATGYSSNTEFMNVGNSFLVKYKLVENPADEGSYPKGCIWADADTSHAASLMKYVFSNSQESKKVGARAGKEIRSLLSPETIGHQIRNRLELIMARTNDSTESSHIHQLRAEKTRLQYQIQAWKKTAKQIQKELKQAQLNIAIAKADRN